MKEAVEAEQIERITHALINVYRAVIIPHEALPSITERINLLNSYLADYSCRLVTPEGGEIKGDTDMRFFYESDEALVRFLLSAL